MQQNTKSHFIHPHLFYLREEVWLILVFLKHRPHTQKRVEDIFMFVFCVHVGVQNVCGTRVVMLSQIHCTVAFSMHIAKNVSLSSSHNTAQQFSWDADCVHRGSSLGNLNMSVLWQAGQWMIHCLNCATRSTTATKRQFATGRFVQPSNLRNKERIMWPTPMQHKIQPHPLQMFSPRTCCYRTCFIGQLLIHTVLITFDFLSFHVLVLGVLWHICTMCKWICGTKTVYFVYIKYFVTTYKWLLLDNIKVI